MSDDRSGRRVFLQRLTFFGGGVLLFGPACNSTGAPVPAPPKVVSPGGPQLKALGQTTRHFTFVEEDFAILSAAVDRILPKDDDPGAVELGVPDYIDRTLQTPELHKMREDFMDGLAVLDKRAHGTYGKPFPQLAPDEKDALLTQFKDATKGSGEQVFFETLLTMTLEGCFGDPAYGGNKDKGGWALLGFGTWTPKDYTPDQGLATRKKVGG